MGFGYCSRGHIVDVICNRQIEFDITLPELQSFYADMGITLDFAQ